MVPHERWTALLDILGRDGRLDVALAAGELKVSAAAASVAYDLPLRYKTGRHTAEKFRIGAAAAALIQPGSVVAVNGGTTTSEVARALVTGPAGTDYDGLGDNPAFTVVTNALNIANDLAVRRNIELVVTGGVARPSSYELIGPLAEPAICATADVDVLITDTAADPAQVAAFEAADVRVIRA